jgi:hypothetical protein
VAVNTLKEFRVLPGVGRGGVLCQPWKKTSTIRNVSQDLRLSVLV